MLGLMCVGVFLMSLMTTAAPTVQSADIWASEKQGKEKSCRVILIRSIKNLKKNQ